MRYDMLVTYDNIRERYDMLTPNDLVLVNENLLWMLLKQQKFIMDQIGLITLLAFYFYCRLRPVMINFI